jgi:hypothetical protein
MLLGPESGATLSLTWKSRCSGGAQQWLCSCMRDGALRCRLVPTDHTGRRRSACWLLRRVRTPQDDHVVLGPDHLYLCQSALSCCSFPMTKTSQPSCVYEASCLRHSVSAPARDAPVGRGDRNTRWISHTSITALASPQRQHPKRIHEVLVTDCQLPAHRGR